MIFRFVIGAIIWIGIWAAVKYHSFVLGFCVALFAIELSAYLWRTVKRLEEERRLKDLPDYL